MKKFMCVVAVAAVLVFAFAPAAFAGGWIRWPAAVADGQTGSPHSVYTTTTTKCEVCHAVHGARAASPLLWGGSGTPVTGATNSCAYCHQTTSGGYVQVYYGTDNVVDWDAYASSESYGNDGHGISCTGCHSVHGAGILTDGASTVAYFANYNLRDRSDLSPGGSNAPTTWQTSSTRAEQQTFFCAQCHSYYSADTAGVAGQNNEVWGVGTDTQATAADDPTLDGKASHPMVAAGTYSYAAAGNRGGTIGAGTAVAWKDATYCRSCHDAGTDNLTLGAGRVLGASFPHFTEGYAGFLVSAAHSTADAEEFDYVVGNGLNAGDLNAEDGACLKCHRSATAGVGTTY